MAKIQWPKGDTFVEDWKIRRPYVQDVIIEGIPTAGTFTLSVPFPSGIETTDQIPYNANAAAVQSFLENLKSVDAGDVTVSGGPGPGAKWTVTWNTNAAYTMGAAGAFSGGTQPKVYVLDTAFDLTGATILFAIKTGAEIPDASGTLVHTWTQGSPSVPAGSIASAVPSNGKVIHTITKEETDSLVAGVDYIYVVRVTDAASKRTTVDSGTWQVTVP